MTDTKQIIFEGRSYTVPVWVEWVARDEDGSIYGYDLEPNICHKESYFFTHGRRLYLNNWRDSLTKV